LEWNTIIFLFFLLRGLCITKLHVLPAEVFYFGLWGIVFYRVVVNFRAITQVTSLFILSDKYYKYHNILIAWILLNVDLFRISISIRYSTFYMTVLQNPYCNTIEDAVFQIIPY